MRRTRPFYDAQGSCNAKRLHEPKSICEQAILNRIQGRTLC